MRVALGSDHGGLALKRRLWSLLQELEGITAQDFGTNTEQSVDYPDFAWAVARAVAAGKVERGILICGTGIGMSMAANRVPGVRCALCADPLTARLSREHNDANVLALGGRIIGPEMAVEIVRVWLQTPFAGGRHKRRIEKIELGERGREAAEVL